MCIGVVIRMTEDAAIHAVVTSAIIRYGKCTGVRAAVDVHRTVVKDVTQDAADSLRVDFARDVQSTVYVTDYDVPVAGKADGSALIEAIVG